MAVGYIRDAEAYRRAALLVHPREEPGSDPDMLPPALFLLSHAVELALKAYLLSQGVPDGWNEGELKHPAVRHDLVRLHDLAVAHGFVANGPHFDGIVDWLGPFHRGHAFRYRQTGWATLPAPSRVADLLAPVIADIGRSVAGRAIALGQDQRRQATDTAGITLAAPE
ncbi:hypothetical protein [Methylobacterium sp. J-026]|uniref:hypothetical protein n=1 Tax=Methylobacterium sp. J-026 TaxID=2836624 RepID=UPI001FBA190D|nr:hypothetical protein [Methylobacterium sp. J-026]